MVFLDFTVFVVFFTGSDDFLETPDFYIFVGGKPHFFCTLLYVIKRVRIWGILGGKSWRECSEGKLMWVSGLKLPGEPDMVSHKSDQITHDGVQVIWPKVQGARVFHNSCINLHLYLANTSAH